MIVEDGAFIGSRSIVVEGVRIGEGAVLGANVVLTASTPVIDVTRPGAGRAPRLRARRARSSSRGRGRRSSRPGTYGVPAALIIGERSASTDLKTSLNDALRTHDVAV